MRIRMLVQKTGARWDGQDWPDRGGELDVPDDEGAALCGQGDAVPVADGDSHAVPDRDTADVETRGGTVEASGAGAAGSAPPPAPEPSAPPRVNAPRSDWETHAVASGASQDDVAGMTKADLIAMYGKGAA